MRERYGIDLADIVAARQRLGDDVHTTPVFTSQTLDGLAKRKVCENVPAAPRGYSIEKLKQ